MNLIVSNVLGTEFINNKSFGRMRFAISPTKHIRDFYFKTGIFNLHLILALSTYIIQEMVVLFCPI